MKKIDIHKISLSALVCIVFSVQIIGQGIKVGERCPAIEIRNIMNFTSEKASMSDFLGKPVVFDFWEAGCKVCLEGFPKLDSMQKSLGDKIRIVLVTHHTKEKVLQTFRRFPPLANIKLTSIVEDTLLNLLFPHVGRPHQIWIDKDGIVQSIIGGESISEKNLQLLIEGKSLAHLTEKKSILNRNRENPLIAEGYVDSKNKILTYSYLAGQRSELSSVIGVPQIDSLSGLIRFVATNSSVEKLYKFAYSNPFFYTDPRIILLFNDPNRLRPDFKNHKNVFCYELIIKDTSRRNFLNQMKRDLDMHFNISSRRLEMPLECVILKKISQDDRLKAKKKDRPISYIENGFTVFADVPFSNIVLNYLEPQLKIPVIDETGYRGRVDIKLPLKVESIEALNDLLFGYGLSVKKEIRNFEVVGLFDE